MPITTDKPVKEISYNSIKMPMYHKLQDKSVTPTESTQTVRADSGNDGLGIVTVNPIDSNYVGSSIPRKTQTDLSVSGATVTTPSGYYASEVSKSVASGTAGTPSASKGTVSNHQVIVTPSVTNTTGYITGGTKTGTGVVVKASDLVSGSETKTENGTYDVTNLSSLVVDVNMGEGFYDVSSIDNGNNTQTLVITDAGTGSGSGGGGGTIIEPNIQVEQYPKSELNYYDIYGNRIFSQTYDDYLLNGGLEDPPDIGCLINGKWARLNKNNVENYKKYHCKNVPVSAIYNISDNALHIFINNSMQGAPLNPVLRFKFSGTILINWGDGISETVSGLGTSTMIAIPHTYAIGGLYEIIIIKGSTTLINSCGLQYPFFDAPDDEVRQNSAYHRQLYKVYVPCWAFNTSSNNNGYTFTKYTLSAIVFDDTDLPPNMTRYTLSGNYFYDAIVNIISAPKNYLFSTYPYAFQRSRARVIFNTVHWTYEAQDCTYLEEYLPYLSGGTAYKQYCFYNCKSIEYISIQETITTIENYAFYGVGANDIYFFGTTPPSAESNSFTNLNTTCIIHVPEGCLDAYTSAQYYPDSSVYTYVDDLEDVTAVNLLSEGDYIDG